MEVYLPQYLYLLGCLLIYILDICVENQLLVGSWICFDAHCYFYFYFISRFKLSLILLLDLF